MFATATAPRSATPFLIAGIAIAGISGIWNVYAQIFGSFPLLLLDAWLGLHSSTGILVIVAGSVFSMVLFFIVGTFIVKVLGRSSVTVQRLALIVLIGLCVLLSIVAKQHYDWLAYNGYGL